MSDETREPAPEEPQAGKSDADNERTSEEPVAGSEAPAEEPLPEDVAAIHDSLEGDDTADLGGAVESEAEDAHGAADVPEADSAESLPGGDAAQADSSVDEVAPSEIDMGPAGRSNTWVWVGLAVGVLIAAGAIGYAWWYTTSRPIVVPDIVGNVPAQAVQILNDVDLRFGEMSEEVTDTAPPGTIIAQTPAALVTLKPGDQVSFVVAAPPDMATVPDLSGRSAEQAAEDLAKARLVALDVDIYDANVAKGFVVSQLPSAGVELPPGSSVGLAVSRGPAPAEIRVPELVGLTEADAAALLSAAKLRGSVYRSFDPSITAGVVIAQAPAPGTTTGLDGIVQYLVSDGPGERPVTVPDVKGRTQEEATKALKAVPLEVQVRSVSHPTVAKGVVISQIPTAGSKTARNAKVGILVSKGNAQRVPAPDLAGKNAEDAEKACSSGGLTWFGIEVATGEHKQGLVFGQYPVAGTEWPLRFPVIGVIAKAP
jgi:beta-lactam-binding protein with PASTA domain